MKYKMVVIDIDGTLVDKHGNLTPEDKYAVQRLTGSGIIVSLCTGRVIAAAMPVIKELGLRGFHIFYDGSLIYNPENMSTLYAKPLETAVVRDAIDFTRLNNIHLELYSSEKFFSERPHWSDEVHRNFFGVDPTFVNFDDIWDKERLLKAEILHHDDEEAAQVKLFENHFGDRLRYSIARSPAYPEIDFINIVNPEVSKGVALGKMLEFYGHLPAEVIAIGDGLNDIPLLQAAGVSVAMGNAYPEVKQASDYITLPIEEHGVAAAINFFFPV